MHRYRWHQLETVFLERLASDDGLYLEFGVFEGDSINFIATYNPTKTIYGFDSFEGLPDDWYYKGGKGVFDRHGNMPEVNKNVRLIKGWFDKTLPQFIDEHNEKCAFVHIDCDIYSSAKTVLRLLGDKITHGTIIVFDEFFWYPTWQEHEFKAFHEFVTEQKLEYEYISCCDVVGSCAVKIK